MFGDAPTPAGEGMRRWVARGKGRLISGGKLQRELRQASGTFFEWAFRAQGSGRFRLIADEDLEAEVTRFSEHPARQSDDPHVLAVASVSGARLLFSNDLALQRDFRSKELIAGPRGRVYSTLRNKKFDKAKRDLLDKARPC